MNTRLSRGENPEASTINGSASRLLIFDREDAVHDGTASGKWGASSESKNTLFLQSFVQKGVLLACVGRHSNRGVGPCSGSGRARIRKPDTWGVGCTALEEGGGRRGGQHAPSGCTAHQEGAISGETCADGMLRGLAQVSQRQIKWKSHTDELTRLPASQHRPEPHSTRSQTLGPIWPAVRRAWHRKSTRSPHQR